MVSRSLSSKRPNMPSGDAGFMIGLTPELREFLANPPPGRRRPETTPDQRLTALDLRIDDIRAIRKGMS